VIDDALDRLARYAVRNRNTVERYDLGGAGDPVLVSEDELIAAALHPERGYRRMYWAAIRNDVVAPANVSALASLRDLLRGDADEQVRKVAQLSDLRLLDILTWQP
jgi:hypothetical protein